MIDKRVSPNFWLSEFLNSDHATRNGIDNTPTMAALANIETILGPGMQRVRDLLGVPVVLSSGYRGDALNRAVGGSANSAHKRGLAADFRAPEFGTPRKVIERLLQHSPSIRADQMIYEGTWVHIAWPEAGQKARGEVLTAHFGPNGVAYSSGLT